MKKIVFALFFLALYAAAFAQQGGRKIALVIGNGKYADEKAIPNASNDAQLMATTLENLGFVVLKRMDANKETIESAIKAFGGMLRNNNVALFYYSGHGINVDGQNYIVPVGAKLDSKAALNSEAVNLNKILGQFKKQPELINLLVADVFRPLEYAGWAKSGFAKVTPPSGTFVAYAAEPGSASGEGGANYGLYTEKLCQQITVHQTIDQVFENTRVEVADVNILQKTVEWSKLNGKFYFKTNPMQKSLVNSKSEIFIVPAAEKPAILKVNCTMNGKFYLDDQTLGSFEKNSTYTLPNIAPGKYKLKLNKWTAEIDLQPGKTYEVTTGDKMEAKAIKAVDKAGVEMIPIVGGTFKMGSETGDEDEKPVHLVTLKDFSLSRYEITNSQYVRFLNDINCAADGKFAGQEYIDMDDEDCLIEFVEGKFQPKADKALYPAVEVSWYGAAAYCEWAGGRLPTEAEWEYAARGGQKTSGKLFSGSNKADDVAWYRDNSKNGDVNKEFSVQPVGRKMPNELGLYDMSGNVWEWCSDWYGKYTNAKADNPKGAKKGRYRSLRGGSSRFEMARCRVAYRYSRTPMYSNDDRGFRLARD